MLVDATGSTAAHAAPEATATLYNIRQASDNLTDWIEDEQGQKFVQGDSVLDVFDDAFFSREDVQRLPNPQLMDILGVLESEFMMMYDACIYGKKTSNDDVGRLSRLAAWNDKKGSNKPSSTGFRIETDKVVASTSAKGSFLEVFFNDDSSVVFQTDDDMAWAVDKFNRMIVSQYSDEAVAAIEQVSKIESQPSLEIMFRNAPATKQSASPDPIDNETTTNHLAALRAAPVGIHNTESATALDDVLTEGYFTGVEQLEIARFLSGYSDTARLRYFYSVPQLIDEIARVTDANMAYIPQRDVMLLSRNPVPDEVTKLNEAFPEQQQLASNDDNALASFLGQHRHALSNPVSLIDRLREREQLITLIESAALSDSEVIDYHLTSWYPEPTTDAVYEKVREGQEVRDAFTQLTEYGFTVQKQGIDSVRLAVAPRAVDADVYPCTEFQPRYVRRGASLSFNQFTEEFR